MLRRRYGDFSATPQTAKDNRMRGRIEDKAFLILIVVVSLEAPGRRIAETIEPPPEMRHVRPAVSVTSVIAVEG